MLSNERDPFKGGHHCDNLLFIAMKKNQNLIIRKQLKLNSPVHKVQAGFLDSFLFALFVNFEGVQQIIQVNFSRQNPFDNFLQSFQFILNERNLFSIINNLS
jgi:hypothetical protein